MSLVKCCRLSAIAQGLWCYSRHALESRFCSYESIFCKKPDGQWHLNEQFILTVVVMKKLASLKIIFILMPLSWVSL